SIIGDPAAGDFRRVPDETAVGNSSITTIQNTPAAVRLCCQTAHVSRYRTVLDPQASLAGNCAASKSSSVSGNHRVFQRELCIDVNEKTASLSQRRVDGRQCNGIAPANRHTGN